MEAATAERPAPRAKSVGLSIQLPHEQACNLYREHPHLFPLLFSPQVCFVKYSMGFVFMPGGFGTIDELFETLTLVQTERIPRFPLIFV